MRLYNALTQRVEKFEPAGPEVTIYVCGITPYDTTHLGHCFTYSSFDILIRYLEWQGIPVCYVQNVTDIDDDILRKAREVDEDWFALGNRWTTHFIEDNRRLNIRPPDHYPRATDVIEEIIDTVQALLVAGVAYESAGNVYFHVEADPHFGKLSRLAPEEMLPVANERGNHPDDPHKRDPLDFVLWQAHSPGEPAWESPWGPGRPGWHIECSTLSEKYLGQPIDVHGGGIDLAFPHHECEIAQAENATGKTPFTRYWLHVAMVRYQGEKMSKSLGNLVMVRDLLGNGWSPDALRLCMANHHYRRPWSYREEDLAWAAGLANRLREAASIEGGTGESLPSHSARESFQAALDNDLNSPGAIAAVSRLADEIIEAAGQGETVSEAQETLRELAGVLGLRLDNASTESRVDEGWAAHRLRFREFSVS